MFASVSPWCHRTTCAAYVEQGSRDWQDGQVDHEEKEHPEEEFWWPGHFHLHSTHTESKGRGMVADGEQREGYGGRRRAKGGVWWQKEKLTNAFSGASAQGAAAPPKIRTGAAPPPPPKRKNTDFWTNSMYMAVHKTQWLSHLFHSAHLFYHSVQPLDIVYWRCNCSRKEVIYYQCVTGVTPPPNQNLVPTPLILVQVTNR